MNQRFQNEEIRHISEQYADNELYKAINTIGMKLESELTGFGLCTEECFIETLEVLTLIAEKGEEILPDLENLWLRKYNEYRRLGRTVDEEETRKVVGIVFGFAILAIDSSQKSFYRHTLSRKLTYLVAAHGFNGWEQTLVNIFSVPLPDGWFDHNLNQVQDKPKESGTPTSLALSNTIFNPRLFTTEAQYEQLRDTILTFINLEECNDEKKKTKVKFQMYPTIQSEWFYIMEAIREAKVTNKHYLTDSKFLHQMYAWFPSLFLIKEGEDEAKMLRRYAVSLSRERQLWVSGIEKQRVAICDMFAHSNARGYEQGKTLRIHGVAEGLKKQLQELSNSIT